MRTKQAAEIIARRRRLRATRSNSTQDRSWMKYIRCEICGESFCCNNYPDRKPRAFKWLGKICCAYCRFKVKPVVDQMIEDKVLKVRKKAL